MVTNISSKLGTFLSLVWVWLTVVSRLFSSISYVNSYAHFYLLAIILTGADFDVLFGDFTRRNSIDGVQFRLNWTTTLVPQMKMLNYNTKVTAVSLLCNHELYNLIVQYLYRLVLNAQSCFTERGTIQVLEFSLYDHIDGVAIIAYYGFCRRTSSWYITKKSVL